MSGLVSGALSKDFPLFHSKDIPIHISHDDKNYTHRISKNTFVFTNEHPDFFRIKGMKESGYRNPYLDEVIKVDRSEHFKKLDFNRKQLNLINLIKSDRKYSQDPKILRYISNANDFIIQDKREQIRKDKEQGLLSRNNTFNKGKNNSYNLTEDNTKNANLLMRLNGMIPRMDYKMGTTIDYTDSGIGNKLRRKNFLYGPNKSSYLRNINDYEVSEAQGRNIEREINHLRKPIYRYDLLNGKTEKMEPPPYKNPNWGSFFENYFTLVSERGNFRRKGGLFSEFSDKNRNVIFINKREIQKRLQQEKENKKSNSAEKK